MNYKLAECLSRHAAACGPCSIGGFLSEARLQFDAKTTESDVRLAIAELSGGRGVLERYDTYDATDEPRWDIA